MNIKFDPIAGKTAEIIEAVMTSSDLPTADDIQFKIRLCVEEVVENIVNYAYAGGIGYIDINTSVDDGMWSIVFRDGGVEFNPLAKPDPDISLGAMERPIGGLGIFLCKQMMDIVDYHYEKGCNVFKMSIKSN